MYVCIILNTLYIMVQRKATRVHAVMGDDHHGASRVLSIHTAFSSHHRGKIHNVMGDILPK